MKVDLYKRREKNDGYSYLAVPEGRAIPEEVTNTDWETARAPGELDDGDYARLGMTPQEMQAQIGAKGYAISSVNHHARG